MERHEEHVLNLIEQLRKHYDSVRTNVVVEGRKRKLCEIDVLAMKDDEIDIFEVKCSPRLAKARKQMKKVKKYSRYKDANFYVYCGDSSEMIEIKV